VSVITGRLAWKPDCNPAHGAGYEEQAALFKTVLSPDKHSRDKKYSLHEPDVWRIGKGEEDKGYEFGNKVSITTSIRAVILGALSFRNEYDVDTIDC
jgi:IS5 family transposase